jgi:hypothetical protein
MSNIGSGILTLSATKKWKPAFDLTENRFRLQLRLTGGDDIANLEMRL